MTTTFPPHAEIDWLDLSEKMAVGALPKFGKVSMKIGEVAPITVSYKTARAEAHRRCWHFSNVRFYDLAGC